MTLYNSLNVKLSNSQLNKLKSVIQNETYVAFRLSLNMIGSSNDEANFPYKLLLSNRQIFTKTLQIIHQLTSSYQKFNYLK